MNEFKGTPGPWDFSWHVQPNGCPTVGHKGLMVCMVAHSAKEPSQKETALADAALIAAAPELLQALQMMLDDECPLTGNPTRQRLIEHWQYELEQGNGYAENALFALRTVAKALGEKS